jgi:predicted membrane protein
MQKIMDYVSLELLFIFNLSAFLILIILIVINRLSIMKFKKKYKNLLIEDKEGGIGTKINDFFEKSNEIKEDYKKIEDRVLELEKIIGFTVKKVAILRYNAFDNVGSDLSFSVAMLNDENNGFVISGLYSRDNSATYAKPINDSESSYTLSDEEKKVVEKAKEDYENNINKLK